ncbi:MAG: hypothetical protein EOQ86_14740 [Mesorhizobium sp.]|uniref:hypothetical protein n=1 Tax=Mesorhizobium sp. TaxID=1871066 RepID=UPI000FE8EE34|nr:hypothetical protein [Mesorhizobium sp.]RWH79157.1 MAG: hypothetical protein EOQ85_13090 [Mesorhizobium sp.]RWH81686.1 MAG: hypothetical protein EOQ86_14740 [Mesorhizobium sp.]RWH86546.1 MAG: hypothetical protein EOQ87_27070 [Mesorhizobium sp.]RWI01724.1 MAG: hypothetical protein EOQ88_04790 [Mesorhizobium sp.]RWI02171.1 MAG: hypothetical protein EOQ89_15995 [Mesorhizobium sp.]
MANPEIAWVSMNTTESRFPSRHGTVSAGNGADLVRQVGYIDRQVGIDVGKLVAVGSGLKNGRFSRH